MAGRLARFLRGAAFRKGVVGSSRGWFAIWAGMGLARFVRKRLGRQEDVVERIVLRPGEVVEIRDTAIPKGAFEA
jgi:hypothetical protein